MDVTLQIKNAATNGLGSIPTDKGAHKPHKVNS